MPVPAKKAETATNIPKQLSETDVCLQWWPACLDELEQWKINLYYMSADETQKSFHSFGKKILTLNIYIRL